VVWAAARCSTYAGHDHPEYIKTHLEFSEGLRPSDYAVLYWLTRVSPGGLHIFDFGGNVGNLYYSYRTYLNQRSPIVDWTVFDLPKTIEEGRRIASERGVSELRFTSSLQGFSSSHILLISGALHYWEKSMQAFVEQFPHQPEHIILNRTPVHETQPSFITVQYKKSYAVPCVVRNTAKMLEAFDVMGYTVVDRWPALELALRMPLHPDRTVLHYSGFYLRHREAKANTSRGADRDAA
jgi:putative methyltransferase (TIGR04325 family)